MPIILSILFLLITQCFGSTAIIWYPPTYQWYVTDNSCIVVRHGEYASYTWMMEQDGTWRAYSKYQWHYVNGQWETQGIDIVTTDRERFHSNEYTVQEMSHAEFLVNELIPGWLGNDPNRPKFDEQDILLLTKHWPGHKVVVPVEPNEPAVIIDPNAMAIVERYITTASPAVIAEVLGALARGDDLMGPVTIYKLVPGWYHRPVCNNLPRGSRAIGKLETMPLIEAVLIGKKQCPLCLPPTIGDK